MDRLQVLARRGLLSPQDLVVWIRIVQEFVAEKHRNKFCRSLMENHWGFVEKLFFDRNHMKKQIFTQNYDELLSVLFEH
jgi:hypothetical protein